MEVTDADRLDTVKQVWEAAARIHPSGEPHCLVIHHGPDESMAMAYVETAAHSHVLTHVADHVMSHLVSQARPEWIAHAGIVFTVDPDVDWTRYEGRSLQDAATAGDTNVQEVLRIAVCDDLGIVSQNFTRPLNEPVGEPSRGLHEGYVASILSSMWTGLSA